MNTSATGGFLAPSSPLPAEDAALDAILQALVVGVLGLPGNLVRPRWQEKPPIQPEPGTDWCAIGILDEDPEFNIALMHTGGVSPPNVGGHGFSVSVDVDVITVLASLYGPNARGNAKLLRTGLMIAQNREALYFHGIELVEMPGKSLFLPDLVNTRTLRRVDISMRFRRRTEIVWPILDVIGLDGTLNTDDGASVPLITPHSLSPLEE